MCLSLWLRPAIHIPDALIYYAVEVRTDSTDVTLVLNPPAQKSLYQKQHPLTSSYPPSSIILLLPILPSLALFLPQHLLQTCHNPTLPMHAPSITSVPVYLNTLPLERPRSCQQLNCRHQSKPEQQCCT